MDKNTHQPVAWIDDDGMVFWKDGIPPDGTDLFAAQPVPRDVLMAVAEDVRSAIHEYNGVDISGVNLAAIADRYASQVQPEPVNQQLLAALKTVLPWVVTQEIACNGLKCREPVCMSCSFDSEKSSQQAAADYAVAAASIAAAEAAQPDRVMWGMDKKSILALAAELVRGAECMADDETDLTLEVRHAGTVQDDDGSVNTGPVLAIFDTEYPEEGVYPIDPANPTAGREPEQVSKPEPAVLQQTVSVTDERAAFEAWLQEGIDATDTVRPSDDKVEAYFATWLARAQHPASDQPVAVPDGYVLVPVEPTHMMLDAAVIAGDEPGSDYYTIYSAMLSAAQKQEGV